MILEYNFQANIDAILKSIRSTPLVIFLLVFFSAQELLAQVEQKRYLFQEDAPQAQKNAKKQAEQLIKPANTNDNEFDFKAPHVEYLQEQKIMKGSGGVLLSRDGIQIQSDSAEVATDSNNAKLDGDVVFSWTEGEVAAQSGILNLTKESGEFKQATVQLEEANYRITADDLFKDDETNYRFFNSVFSTCQCPDGELPWSVNCSKASLEEEGYAHTYGTTFRVNDFPVFYTPYFIVPVKTQRQSGLLVPTYGYSSEDGVQFSIPLFLVLDDYSDLTFTPFIENQTRAGTAVDYRKVFSRNSQLETRWYYSDESRREGDLRGTRVDDLFQKTFDEQDENRYGGFLTQQWSSDPSALVPTRINSDIHYVSDDLFLREMEDSEVGDPNARYTSSQILMQNTLPGGVYTEIGGEYNQSFIIDDDLVFQRLPEVNLSTREVFRPFGYNPYGLKLVAGLNLNATDFVRKENYDGWRYNINPSVKIPHHYQNYLNAEFSANLHETHYNQSNYQIPNSDSLISEDSRRAYVFSYTLGTAVERVYDVAPNDWLAFLTGLGADNQSQHLTRVKHVVEPFINYSYVPYNNQDNLPLYDSLDRIRQRSLVSYGFRTSLLGKFEPLTGGTSITEITPEIQDLPTLDPGLGLGSESVFGSDRFGNFGRGLRNRVNEIAYLGIAQSYDYVEDQKNLDATRTAFSDIGYELGINTSSYFSLLWDGNWNIQDHDFSSWALGGRFRDDRGDLLTLRYSFIDERVSQLDTNLELVLTDRLKLGFYGRFDDEESEFIENEAALRIMSACNCWYIDLGYKETVNPDKQQGMLRFTLLGLGDFVSNFSLDRNKQLGEN